MEGARPWSGPFIVQTSPPRAALIHDPRGFCTMANLLSGETSPYLLQHAHHPVHWQPWRPEALAQARREDKPILLSIGYASCHWCHVMAHESFEDEAVAAQMNEHFVCIKVDREERPDLDRIYQSTHELLTRKSGGWPLTVFLSPDGTPFHSGTYYPPTAQYGRPAFTDLLASVHEAWAGKRSSIEAQNQAVREALDKRLPSAARDAQGQAMDPARLRAALAGPAQAAAAGWLSQTHDAQHGGFGDAPKFPHPTDLVWWFEHALSAPDEGARQSVLQTLRAMAEGGLFDQLGGGFFRYSVDARWDIPHFEKMLGENGLLLGLYAQALAHTGETLFAHVVDATVHWMLREMQGVWPDVEPAANKDATTSNEPKPIPPLRPNPDDGQALGFMASMDADSEGAEGRFYVWNASELREALTPLEWDLAAAHWNLLDGPNFENRHWHLRVVRPAVQLARTLDQPLPALQNILDAARLKLLRVRSARPRPARDGQVLTGWNALAIQGLAQAAAVTGRQDALRAARRALDFVRKHLWVPPAPGAAPRLLAVWCAGRARHDATLDDHAYLLDALLTLIQADFRPEDLSWAQALADALLNHFEDPDAGGFFFTRHDHEPLIHRPKPAQDQALPGGNAVAAGALLRLGLLCAQPRWLRAAERTLELFAADAARHPGGWSRLLQSAVEAACPPAMVVLRGPEADAWRDAVLRHAPLHTLVVATSDPGLALPGALDHPWPENGITQAWVCHDQTCSPPIADLSELMGGLGLQHAPANVG